MSEYACKEEVSMPCPETELTEMQRLVNHARELRSYAMDVEEQADRRVTRMLGDNRSMDKCGEEVEQEPGSDIESIQNCLVDIRRSLGKIQDQVYRI
jgi:hypothetical protein